LTKDDRLADEGRSGVSARCGLSSAIVHAPESAGRLHPGPAVGGYLKPEWRASRSGLPFWPSPSPCKNAIGHDYQVIWWAVAIDNEAVGEKAQWDPEGVPLKLNRPPPNEELVRNGALTSTRNGFIALRCSANAEDSDGAVRLALEYYERYLGEQITGITRVAAMPEGDLNMGSAGRES
jgi:hypothetical protein